jgi:hypothetical protein
MIGMWGKEKREMGVKAFVVWYAAALMLLFVLAPSGAAQTVTVGAGYVFAEGMSEPALEVFVGGPKVLGVVPNVVVGRSGDDDGVSVVLAKVARPLWASDRGFAGVEAGVNWLRFRDYEAEPMVGAFGRVKVRGPLGFFVGVSAEPFAEWGWSAVAKVDVVVWRR